jgi:L-2-hydroxyglutarate oxidase
VDRDGRLVDDFLIVEGERSIHVCNAPSPAATAAFPIGRAVAGKVGVVATADDRTQVQRAG